MKMIMEGNNIAAVNDPMRKIQIENLVAMLRNPSAVMDSRIRQLRIVYNLDSKQYSMLKKSLPYIVCGIFSPPFRRKDNFAYIEYFIIDIDKLSDKGLDIAELKSRICTDENVLLCFSSPSEDGLKVMFRLEERCYDAGLYSIFYKEFARLFSVKHNIEQVIDSRTSDVTRACFVSIDRNLYFNSDAVPVKMKAFIDVENPASTYDDIDDRHKATVLPEKKSNPDPDSDIIARIKEKLNTGRTVNKNERPVYVPEEIQAILSGLKEYVESTGVEMTEAINIQYGKKLRFRTTLKQAEINIFYGKRGFSVVKTTKCGTDEQFNEMMVELIRRYIYNMEKCNYAQATDRS